MPYYNYRCSECGHEFELLQRITEDNPDTCPECEAEKTLERIHKMRGTTSGFMIDIKGGGSVPARTTALSRRRYAGIKKSDH